MNNWNRKAKMTQGRLFPQSVYCGGSSPNSCWGSILELATLTGHAPALCVRALCPGLVLLLCFSCPLAALTSPVSFSGPCLVLLLSSCPSFVLLLSSGRADLSCCCPPLVLLLSLGRADQVCVLVLSCADQPWSSCPAVVLWPR